MGSAAFVQYQQGHDAEAAFAAAVADARYLEGAGGYTGSIAEKDSFRIARREPVGRTAAEHLADELMDEGRFRYKWGPAGAIPVCRDHGRFEAVTVKVTPSPGKYATGHDLINQLQGNAVRAAKAKVRPCKGEQVVGVGGVGQPELDVTYKAQAGAGRVTRYYVRGLLYDRPFDTQAQARAWAMGQLQAMARAGQPRLSPVTIQAVTERADGSDLVRIEPHVKSATFTVDVGLSKVVDTAVTGWVFFGWASS